MQWRDIFPFEPRPSQSEFIDDMIKALSNGKPSIFNAPNGFGKTICAIIAAACVDRKKIYYATRTHRQAENVINTVKVINEHHDTSVLSAMELSGKDRSCMKPTNDPFSNPSFSCPGSTGASCKIGEHQSSWLVVPSFAEASDTPLPVAITSREIAGIVLQQSFCPYYFSTFVHDRFDLVACSYNHILDSTVRSALGMHLEDSIVIFDEAHNVIDAAESFLSCELSSSLIKKILQSSKLSKFSLSAIGRLESMMSMTDRYFKREGEAFTRVKDVTDFLDESGFSRAWLSKVIASLKKDCEDNDIASSIISFMSMLLYDGKKTIFCRNDKKGVVADRSVKITSMDVKPLFDAMLQEKTKITFMSGTMSPGFFTSRVGIAIPTIREFVLPQRNLMVFPACRSLSSQKKLSSYFYARNDPDVLNGFGDYLHDVLPFIPNGSIVFFPSYAFRDAVTRAWERKGYLDYDDESRYCFSAAGGMSIPVFTEQAHDNVKTSISQYKKLAMKGNALLLSIFRGGASEGEDFPGKQCKGVFCIGVPLRSVESPEIKYKMNYYDTIKPGMGDYWLQWDAMTVVSQAIGRGIRDPFHDTSFAVLLDTRYCESLYQSLLSTWIRDRLDPDGIINTPGRVATAAKSFFPA